MKLVEILTYCKGQATGHSSSPVNKGKGTTLYLKANSF